VQRQQAQTWQRDERPTREREGIEVNTLAMRMGSVKARLTDDTDMVQDLNSVQTELPGGLSRTQLVTWRSGIAPVLSSLSLAWCVGIGCVIWFAPLHYSTTSNGVTTVIARRFSEVSSNGALPLALPVMVAGLGTWGAWRGRRLLLGSSALLLTAFTVISGFSIGTAYVPATGLQLLAAGLAAFLGSGPPRSVAV